MKKLTRKIAIQHEEERITSRKVTFEETIEVVDSSSVRNRTPRNRVRDSPYLIGTDSTDQSDSPQTVGLTESEEAR